MGGVLRNLLQRTSCGRPQHHHLLRPSTCSEPRHGVAGWKPASGGPRRAAAPQLLPSQDRVENDLGQAVGELSTDSTKSLRGVILITITPSLSSLLLDKGGPPGGLPQPEPHHPSLPETSWLLSLCSLPLAPSVSLLCSCPPPPAPLPFLLPLYFISTCHKSVPLQSSCHLCSGPLSVAARPERGRRADNHRVIECLRAIVECVRADPSPAA